MLHHSIQHEKQHRPITQLTSQTFTETIVNTDRRPVKQKPIERERKREREIEKDKDKLLSDGLVRRLVHKETSWWQSTVRQVSSYNVAVKLLLCKHDRFRPTQRYIPNNSLLSTVVDGMPLYVTSDLGGDVKACSVSQ